MSKKETKEKVEENHLSESDSDNEIIIKKKNNKKDQEKKISMKKEINSLRELYESFLKESQENKKVLAEINQRLSQTAPVTVNLSQPEKKSSGNKDKLRSLINI